MPPDLHSSFMEWVRENYQGADYQYVMDCFVQSGEYPEDFLDEWRNSDDT